jgi:ATP-dependent protease HslVU (ClpYQ) peptidase subunit
MTTIVAIQGDGFAVVTADSRIVSMMENGATSAISHLGGNLSKVSQNGPYLLGAAGDVRAINILHHAFTPPTPPSNLKGKKLDAFITNKFIPVLRETFEKQGYATPEREASHIAQHDSTVLVVIHGVVYVLDGDYAWCSDSNGYYAIGSGGDYALGALHILLNKKKSLDIPAARGVATKAISTAAKYDVHTGAPYHTYVQDSSGTKDKQPIPIKKVSQNAGRTRNNKRTNSK